MGRTKVGAAAPWAMVLALAVLSKADGASAQDGPSPSAGAPSATIAGALRPIAAPRFSPTVARDQNLVSVPVTYIFTGVLRTEVRGTINQLFFPAPKPIPAGTPVFGVPSSGASGLDPFPKLLWCAVTPRPERTIAPWNVTCFPKVMGRLAFVPLDADLFPARFGVARGPSAATTPDIQPGPIAFTPPLTVLVQFAGWDGGLANLRIVVHQPQPKVLGREGILADQVIGRMHLKPDASGAAHLPLFGGEILIRPGPDGKSAAAELAKPFGSGLR